MANVKLTFFGSEESESTERTIEAYCNQNGELFIQIVDLNGDQFSKQFTVLDKSTAIKFSRELRKQISYLND